MALGIARTKVWALLATGEIESLKVGRRRLVPADAVSAYVERLRATNAESVAAEA